ncbi:DUF4466 family protein [Pedobacter sp. SYP-B3415]|uniref:DUF4466 family protein n=1 Tax=Pedobacter sp. SYP-B3415 TaxID=2496641 RepID=UPI00101C222E|nr:DUF4466 family protein [Pedobacter sp. SYP-B3415]
MKRTAYLIGLLAVSTAIFGCKKNEIEARNKDLTGSFIKRTVAPLIVGEKIDFAYGMGTKSGKLSAVQVTASIAGATGTLWEMVTHRTVNAADVTTLVARNSQTNGNLSTVSIIDTNATTLRYAYITPEAARGQKVSFEFAVTNSAGDRSSVRTPEYQISAMDMKRSIPLVGTAAGARYFSIADMRAYTLAEVEAGNLSAKIDFVYAYAPTITPGTAAYTYGHSLVSPAAAGFLPNGFTIPAAWTRKSTAMEKKIGTWVYDGQLKGDANSNIYIDDIDLQKQNFDGSANYAITLTNDGSVFMKTADGRYTAFVYINSVNNSTSTAVISLKRLQNF